MLLLRADRLCQVTVRCLLLTSGAEPPHRSHSNHLSLSPHHPSHSTLPSVIATCIICDCRRCARCCSASPCRAPPVTMELVPASPSPHFFHLLPSSLFSLTTQFLPLPDKLLHLTHVCRTFPPLTPLSFAFDTLAWTLSLRTQLASSPSSPLPSLLSLVPSLLFVDPPSDSLDGPSNVPADPSPPFPPPSFSALRAVTIAPAWPRLTQPKRQLNSAVAGFRLCPHLTALHLSIPYFVPTDLSPFVSSIPLLPSLHTLRLRAHFAADDFLLLLSLPLTSLDVHASTITIFSPPPSPFPPVHPFHSLLLPSLSDNRSSSPRMSTLWLRSLLDALTSPQPGTEVRLERLLMETADRSCLPYISLFPHLHTLQLNVPQGEEESRWGTYECSREIFDFYTSLISSPRPLRHLRLQHDVMGHVEEGRWWTGVFNALPAFISAYSEQLLTLDLVLGCKSWGTDVDTVVEQGPAGTAKALTEALLSCRSLRRLQMTDHWISASCLAPSSPALPLLKSLHIDMVDRMDEATLAVFLDAAPHLQELTIHSSPLPHEVLLIVGQRCHELRTLVMTQRRSNHSIHHPRLQNPKRWLPLPPGTALPKLTTLICNTRPLTGDSLARIPYFTRVVAYLVHSTPSLRCLLLPHHDWLEQHPDVASLLGGLTELRAMRLGQSEWVQEGRLARYWIQSKSKGPRVQREAPGERVGVWGQEALPRPRWPWNTEPKLEPHRLMTGGALPEAELWAEWEEDAGWCDSTVRIPRFKEEVDGLTGSRAFFAAIAPSPEGSRKRRRGG